MEILGLDIGGSGIKGAVIDTKSGEMKSERFRLKTPQPATPEAVVETAGKVAENFNWSGPIGCGFPAVVKDGVISTAANIDKSWIGLNAEKLLGKRTGCPVAVANDADVAGIAEVAFGAPDGGSGVVFFLTLGTGIGTALLNQGQLVPNTELGHLMLGKVEAEAIASEAAKKRNDMDWESWAKNLSQYLNELDRLFWPDLFMFGGGAVKKYDKWSPHLKTRVPCMPAKLKNLAGIIGAALMAERRLVK
ncbi:ROK family protein [bacterium]|nr:ROK family protein [bacterium]